MTESIKWQWRKGVFITHVKPLVRTGRREDEVIYKSPFLAHSGIKTLSSPSGPDVPKTIQQK